MAENSGAWGIEIGQAGLKAMRLRYAEAADQVLAVAFDYVPHPKILSQPDAIPEELIAQSLETFLSRNDVKGDHVAISVPGQSALTRFIQLPPVETGKVREIVKFEARQQIPFPLEEVIWDFQTVGGGIEEGGFLLNAEVGLFAMKRDQVENSLQPFIDHKIEVETVQVSPLALYNFLSFDRLGLTPGDEAEFDEYTVILDMGADNTTLMVTNGGKIWIRNVPLGGNHFTRALTKELKLTFAKAEHLKCNATKSPDPKAVFQALRPVFNDYVGEIQRSIGYFASVNRDAKITKVLGVGNGFKLAGLQKFLQQNLQYDVERVDSFQSVVGDAVLNNSLFQENILSFVVPYGLALQGIERTKIHTSLLPDEIAMARKIRKKKPWALTAAAIVLMAGALSTLKHSRVAASLSKDRFGQGEQQASTLSGRAGGYKTAYDGEESTYTATTDEEVVLLSPLNYHPKWEELYKAINETQPRDQDEARLETDPTKKQRVKIISVSTEKKSPAELKTWYEERKAENDTVYMLDHEKELVPEGEEGGYIVTLEVLHYHHTDRRTGQGILYIVNTLLNNLQQWEVPNKGPFPLPAGSEMIPIRKMGISHATITDQFRTKEVPFQADGKRARVVQLGGGSATSGLPDTGYPGGYNPDYGNTPGEGNTSGLPTTPGLPGSTPGIPTTPGFPTTSTPGINPQINPNQIPGQKKDEGVKIPETRVTIQFIWKPIPPDQRAEVAPEVLKAQEEAAQNAQNQSPPENTTTEETPAATP